MGTKQILEFCRKKNAKIILASSFAVYGFPNIYALTKQAGEWLCQEYAKKYGTRYTILRFANIYGENFHVKKTRNVVHLFIENLLKSKPLTIFGSGEQTRDFVYVQDLVDCILKSINSDKSEILDVCTGKQTSINYLAESLIETGKKHNLTKFEKNYQPTPPFRKEAIKLIQEPTVEKMCCRTTLEEGLSNTFQYAVNN